MGVIVGFLVGVKVFIGVDVNVGVLVIGLGLIITPSSCLDNDSLSNEASNELTLPS